MSATNTTQLTKAPQKVKGPRGIAYNPRFYRALEIFPGFLTWSIVLAPFYLSFVAPVFFAYAIIAFDLYWLLKSVRMSYGLILAYRRYKSAKEFDWGKRMDQLNDIEGALADCTSQYNSKHRLSLSALLSFSPTAREKAIRDKTMRADMTYLENLNEHKGLLLRPADIYQLIVMPSYIVDFDIVRPSIEAVKNSLYDPKKVIFVLAYEERGGKESEKKALTLAKEYADDFAYFEAIKHPDGIPGELRGKGANITYAAKQILPWITQKGYNPSNVIVTTLDEDNRVDQNYFAALTVAYCSDPNRLHRSFQPIVMFLNNIWDAAAPMRVIASGNSFWNMVEMTRPHRLRNFASHAQGLQSLIDTDFWTVTSVVEDGHQFWRSYFTYDGDHSVVPVYTPIYHDAILADSYRKTFKGQFVQLRRWAWGISDFPYVVTESIKNKRIPFWNKVVQTFRLLEGHVSWATAPLILLYYAWLPLVINPGYRSIVLAHQLPVMASRILTFATVGLFSSIWISLLLLPPRPARYKRRRLVSMLAQWVLLPFTTIAFGAMAALNAQTRLMLGKYLEEFDVTPKSVKK